MDQDFFNLVNSREPNIKQNIFKCQQDLNHDTNNLFFSARDLRDTLSSAIDETNSISVSPVYQHMKDVWSSSLDHLNSAAFIFQNYNVSTVEQINNATNEFVLGIETLFNFDNLFSQPHPPIT